VANVAAPLTGSPAKPLDELLLEELLDELDELLLEELEELLELLPDELLLEELLDELLLVGSSPPQAASIALSIPIINILRIIVAAPYWALTTAFPIEFEI